MRIGVDVGGTNTDAVLVDGTEILATCKQPTTADVSGGVIAAITDVLSVAQVRSSAITVVMIGTTHFTNAFVQRRGLLPVGVLRIGLPAAKALPPLSDWPGDLAQVIGADILMVRGGYQFDGREISSLDEIAVAEAARQFKREGLRAIAVSAVFSPINVDMEERAAEIIRNEHGDANITLSSRIGRIGLLERENAGIMNASLAILATDTIGSFRQALMELGITAPFYISQNDGTLMNAERVEQYPVLTFASGPTNSMRGAAHLSGLKDAIVADIGGTTTDIGVLRNGFPRESALVVDIGGVRTNFRMPDILALGLGGGSRVRSEGAVKIGPDSVGFRLMEEALVFGGSTLTTSDIAVAAGYVDMGQSSLVAHLDKKMVDGAVDEIHHMLEEGVDRMKTSAEPMPFILVGGGGVLISRDISGVTETIVPDHAGVANAIGAAIAQVGGEVDRIFSYDEHGRDSALETAKSEAIDNAVKAGAVRDTVEIIDLEELPLSYIPGGSVRVRVKAAGALAL